MTTLLTLMLLNLPAEDPDALLAGVFRYQSFLGREIRSAAFTARYCYEESEPVGFVNRRIVAEREVTMEQFAHQRNVFRWMELNGRRLSPREMQRELLEWRVQEVVIRRTRLPFNPDRPWEYDYSVEDAEDSEPVIRFAPAGRGDGFLRGRAWIDPADSSIRHMEFTPVGLPFIIENMKLAIDYDYVDGYRMPARFELTMDILVKAVITLYRRHIDIQEEYLDYRLNSLTDGE